MVYITLFAFIIVIIDQIIKIMISDNMLLNSSIEIIKNFFSITYVQNLGAAFSILTGNVIFLIIVSLVALILIYKFFLKNHSFNKLDIFIYSLIFGGIIGNLMDRMIRGYVIDYLDFTILGYSFPIFNLADITIVIGAFLLIINIYWSEKQCKQ